MTDVSSFANALKINHTLTSLSLKKNPITAPVDLWESIYTLRNERVMGIFSVLRVIRERRRDHNAFAIVVGRAVKKKAFPALSGVNDASRRRRRGLLVLDRHTMDGIRDFLWCSWQIERYIYGESYKFFSQSGSPDLVHSVYSWLQNEKSILENMDASITWPGR